MKEPLWQRRRRRRATGGNENGDGSRDASPAGNDAVHDAERIPPQVTPTAAGRPGDGAAPSLGDEGQPPEGRSAAYADWAERMREKRREKQAKVREALGDGPDGTAGQTGPTYWSSEALFEESKRLADEHRTVVATRSELLAVLGLGPGADDEAMQRAYRRLAKEHHPDRYPDADAVVRDHHIDQMRRITAAYRALQDLGSASRSPRA